MSTPKQRHSKKESSGVLKSRNGRSNSTDNCDIKSNVSQLSSKQHIKLKGKPNERNNNSDDVNNNKITVRRKIGRRSSTVNTMELERDKRRRGKKRGGSKSKDHKKLVLTKVKRRGDNKMTSISLRNSGNVCPICVNSKHVTKFGYWKESKEWFFICGYHYTMKLLEDDIKNKPEPDKGFCGYMWTGIRTAQICTACGFGVKIERRKGNFGYWCRVCKKFRNDNKYVNNISMGNQEYIDNDDIKEKFKDKVVLLK